MPERYRIRITRRASDDLAAICTHVAKDSPQNAASVAQELVDAIDSLALFPHRYKFTSTAKIHPRACTACQYRHTLSTIACCRGMIG